MDILQQNLSWLIIPLFLLVILMGIVIFIEEKTKSSMKSKTTNHKTVSSKDYKEVKNQLQKSKDNYHKIYTDYSSLLIKNQQLKADYEAACLEIKKLQTENKNLGEEKKELTRQNKELDYLNSRETSTATTNETVADDNPSPITTKNKVDQENASTKDSENVKSTQIPITPKVSAAKEIMMYASFPRSAGSSVYFSDLTENNVEDSYFELKISKSTGKATFKPLDFLKIRNFDPAMVVIRTEGVKPNVALAVTGIKPGEAHLEEDKEWIVDKPATIKLS